MKYFIDFEATQYTQEIIQIGCVREDGQKFSSLIKPRKIKNITRIITELTGLTRVMFENARSSDEVFADFFDWISTNDTPAEFYCYGTSDLIFVKNNIKKCTHNIKAQAALSLIAANLTDFAKIVEGHFKLQHAPSMKKVMEYYYPNDDHVCHDALSDAEMLCDVYKALIEEKVVIGIPFPDHVGTPMFRVPEDMDRFIIVRLDKAQNRTVYKTFKEAHEFVIKHARNQRVDLNPDVAQKKLIHAINMQKTYYGFTWKTEIKRI
jgi:DNA polymerase III epsilon subunit-like protein